MGKPPPATWDKPPKVGVNFLHRHHKVEEKLSGFLDMSGEKHVIVDRVDWEIISEMFKDDPELQTKLEEAIKKTDRPVRFADVM